MTLGQLQDTPHSDKKHIQIKADMLGRNSFVIVDGVDVSKNVSRVSFNLEAGRAVLVEIEYIKVLLDMETTEPIDVTESYA